VNRILVTIIFMKLLAKYFVELGNNVRFVKLNQEAGYENSSFCLRT
jgi:hypothetical protein